MNPCLTQICQIFETLKGFLNHRTETQEQTVNQLFTEFMSCFHSLKEEKLDYPKEFIGDVRLYHEGFELLHKKFEDIEIRYLMLSDFYDYARLTKKYPSGIGAYYDDEAKAFLNTANNILYLLAIGK